MLNLTKTVSCQVIETGKQIDTKLMPSFEKFSENLLVTFCFIKDFSVLNHELKQIKNIDWGLLL